MKIDNQNNLKAIKGNLCKRIGNADLAETKMLTLARCREILNSGEVKYSDEEVIKVRDYLYRLAAIVSEQLEIENEQAKIILLTERKNNEYAQSDYLRAG